jgi:sortase A
MKKHWPTILLLVVLVVGLSLLLYPSISNYWNTLHSTRAIANYSQQVAELTDDEYQTLLEEAQAFNEMLSRRQTFNLTLSADQQDTYYTLLSDRLSVMSYIEIPSINCSLPIYHGTDDAVLTAGVGHLEGSSLPIGGESTHCVLSGHRGLPSAKLFTDIALLDIGDIFILQTLGETLTYEVDQIRIVEPDDISDLQIVEGEDLCTLVTCTPYGVNSHRLLVRGHRVENQKSSNAIRVTADAIQVEPVVVAPFAAVPILAVMILWVFYSPKRNRSKKRRKDDCNHEKNT